MLMNLFSRVLSMSWTGSIVILAVLLARFLLRRSPKIFSYALWAVVLLRLLCPVSIASPVSLIPREFHGEVQVEAVAPIEGSAAADGQTAAAMTGDPGEPAAVDTDDTFSVMPILCGLWLTGFGAIWLYSGAAYIRLRRKLSDAVPLRDNIFISDHILSPCVAGMLRQRIYLPDMLSAKEQPYIIAHEQHHIRRGDPLVRFLAFAALSVHWFNPLVWLSFHLLVKDMEMSCDEAVVRRLGPDIRSDYSQSLLDLAVGRTHVAWTPLTFGETDTGARIKNILRWRKPAAWTVVLAVVLCGAVSVCALTDPVAEVSDEQPTISTNTPHGNDGIRELVLNQSQQAALELCLMNAELEEAGENPHGDIQNLFAVELQPYTLYYGYCQGESYVTMVREGTAYIVEDETLKWCLYHFYTCHGAIDMHFTELPENAHLRSSHHAEGCDVRLYDYYCSTCAQQETAVVSYYCGCGDCVKFWRETAQEILAGDHH